MCTPEEKEKLVHALGKTETECRVYYSFSAAYCKSGWFQVPDDCTFIMAEESNVGEEYPMTEEKLTLR